MVTVLVIHEASSFQLHFTLEPSDRIQGPSGVDDIVRAMTAGPTATIRASRTGPEEETFHLAGHLNSDTTASIWTTVLEALERDKPRRVLVEAANVEYCDGAGLSLLLEMHRRMLERQGEFRITGLKEEFGRLLAQFDPANLVVPPARVPRELGLVQEVGRAASHVLADLLGLVVFVGELTAALWWAARHPRQVRWRDVWHTMETAGANALPIVFLISFLVGLIMSFQAAIPMRMFGTEIYVANLIALSMFKELGALMTAIVLAGRSGSAFAAEIGTMKINEEVAALTTMGLDPMRFLVVPRVLAAVTMVPLLTVFADLVGLAGGAVVLISLGYPLVTYVKQVLSAITWIHFLQGLIKSFVFGVMIAGIGCLHGLETMSGPSAVGDSTTKAVVSSIVLIVVVDGAFSVVFFYLKI